VLICLWSSICSLCGRVDLYIGYIPCKWKQIYARWIATATTTEDPYCAMVAQASFWRLGGGPSRWSVAALASVCIVCYDRGDRSDLQVSFLAFSYSLHCFGHCLNMRYTRNIIAFQIWCWYFLTHTEIIRKRTKLPL
jgi:hypothetical protein